MKRILLQLVTCWFIFSAFNAGAQTHHKTTQRPNIIYVLADDLGYGDIG